MPTAQLNYAPIVIVDTTNLTEDEWLEYRRTGIGGSDASATVGLSPFITARDLYYDKCHIVSAIEDNDNWVAKEIGHRLESLVAKIFHVKTGYCIYSIKKMFRHSIHPFMIADVDFFIELQDGTTAILEIKTTDENATDFWWDGKEETIPLNYALQGRHYMAVMNLNRVYFCCFYGRTEDDVIIRILDRDYHYEAELIYLEKYFWENHILAEVPPPYTESGNLILKSVYRHFGNADADVPEILLNEDNVSNVVRYLELQRIKSEMERPVKEIENQMKRLKGLIVAEMGTSCTALCNVGGISYDVAYKPSSRTGVDKKNLLRFKLQYPELYDEFVTVSESRRFSIKQADIKEVAV